MVAMGVWELLEWLSCTPPFSHLTAVRDAHTACEHNNTVKSDLDATLNDIRGAKRDLHALERKLSGWDADRQDLNKQVKQARAEAERAQHRVRMLEEERDNIEDKAREDRERLQQQERALFVAEGQRTVLEDQWNTLREEREVQLMYALQEYMLSISHSQSGSPDTTDASAAGPPPYVPPSPSLVHNVLGSGPPSSSTTTTPSPTRWAPPITIDNTNDNNTSPSTTLLQPNNTHRTSWGNNSDVDGVVLQLTTEVNTLREQVAVEGQLKDESYRSEMQLRHQLQAERMSATHAHRQQQEQLQHMQRVVDRLEARIKSSDNNTPSNPVIGCNTTCSEVEHLTRIITSGQVEVDDLRNKCARDDIEIQRLRVALEHLEQEDQRVLTSCEQEMKHAGHEVHRLTTENDSLRKEVEQLGAELQYQQQRTVKVERRASMAETRLHDAQAHIGATTHRLKGAERKVQWLSAEAEWERERADHPYPVVGMDLAEADAYGTEGAVVVNVKPGGAADHTDLRVGDVVVAVERIPVANRADFRNVVSGYKPGDRICVSIQRTLHNAGGGDKEHLVRWVVLGGSSVCPEGHRAQVMRPAPRRMSADVRSNSVGDVSRTPPRKDRLHR